MKKKFPWISAKTPPPVHKVNYANHHESDRILVFVKDEDKNVLPGSISFARYFLYPERPNCPAHGVWVVEGFVGRWNVTHWAEVPDPK